MPMPKPSVKGSMQKKPKKKAGAAKPSKKVKSY